MNEPLESPNFDAMEAALMDLIRRSPLRDEDQKRNSAWFVGMVMKSPVLSTVIDELLDNQLDIAGARNRLPGRAEDTTDHEIRKLGLIVAVSLFFFTGWYARGAVDDESALRRLHGDPE